MKYFVAKILADAYDTIEQLGTKGYQLKAGHFP